MTADNPNLRIAIVQKDFRVGDIAYNTKKIIQTIRETNANDVDLLVFPELTITGYPPEDLLLRWGLYRQVEKALISICAEVNALDVILGLPQLIGDKRYNAAVVIRKGEVLANYRKWVLPNYGVFDEKRYFEPGNESTVFTIKNIVLGLTICEDVWQPEPVKAAVDSGAELLININASPFHVGKMEEREMTVVERVKENAIPLIYVNTVGGQDELVFDGASFVINENQEITTRLNAFDESVEIVEFDVNRRSMVPGKIQPHPMMNEAIYKALVLGVRDYVQKNGFKAVIIGLSGGIDSALTLVVAVDALGAENVEAVMLPTRYTSDMSLDDAKLLAQRLKVKYKVMPIESAFDLFLSMLADDFAGQPVDATEENLQARIRAVLLMALSNKSGKMVLTTGNKSEMAVGYSTLYGDMAGGFDVLKDVPKTRVFEVSRYCNRDHEVIPSRIIERPPSAELRDNQKDQDSLPPYEILDEILEYYIEQDCSVGVIMAKGFDAKLVKKVVRLVDLNEYKRSQSPPGVRITPRAFGRDRRYPITSGFRDE